MIIPEDTQNFIDRVEGDLVFLTKEGCRKVFIHARNLGMRGATSSNRRIRKKVLNKAFNHLLGIVLKNL